MRLVGALVGGVAGSGGVALLVSDVLEESCPSLSVTMLRRRLVPF